MNLLVLCVLSSRAATPPPQAPSVYPGNRGAVWRRLPDLPDPEGLGSPFGGACSGCLLVAGGTNYPGRKPWEGGKKRWYDAVYALDASSKAQWRLVGRLSRPLAYGASVTYRNRVICVGGSDPTKLSSHAFTLELVAGRAFERGMPDLPIPAENLGATVIGHTLYVFGGQVDTVGRTASNRTFGIDLDNVRRGWKELAPMPGPGRILPVVTTVGNSAFVFSGAALVKGARGAIARRYLVDGYRYEPGSRWIRIADLPRPALAAPSPAPFARNFVYVLGGDDGTHIALRPSAHHPGFNRSVLRYDPKANRWDRAGGYLPGVVTAPVAPWRGGWAIISGEIVPGVRSNRVWLFRPPG